MNRRSFVIVFGVGAIAASAAFASPFEDVVVAQLKSQGYKAVTVERTLLGRIKIVGQINDGRREIIINPRTGEILRDLWLVGSGGSGWPRIRDASGEIDDDIDTDEDEDDDEDPEDGAEEDEDDDDNDGHGGG